MIDPLSIRSGNQLDETQIVRGEREVAVAGSVRGSHTFEDGLVIVREEWLQVNVIGNFEVDPVINVEGLIQEWEVEKCDDQQ